MGVVICPKCDTPWPEICEQSVFVENCGRCLACRIQEEVKGETELKIDEINSVVATVEKRRSYLVAGQFHEYLIGSAHHECR